MYGLQDGLYHFNYSIATPGKRGWRDYIWRRMAARRSAGGRSARRRCSARRGGGVGEQMAAEGFTHALGGVGSGIVAHAAALIYDAFSGQLVVGFHHSAVVDRESHGKLLGGGHTLLRRPGAAEHLTVAEVDDLKYCAHTS